MKPKRHIPDLIIHKLLTAEQVLRVSSDTSKHASGLWSPQLSPACIWPAIRGQSRPLHGAVRRQGSGHACSCLPLVPQPRHVNGSSRGLDPAPSEEESCAGPAMAYVHVARRSLPQGLGSRVLVELRDGCCFRSLHQLWELVDQELFERQTALPERPLDPPLLQELPF